MDGAAIRLMNKARSQIKCPKCNAKMVRRGRAGRTAAFRNLAALELPADFPIPMCIRCRHEFLDQEAWEALRPLHEAAYRRVLTRRIQAAISELGKVTSQKRLEQLLGLSQGYLSRLLHGAGVPSPELVSNLAILANDPQTRLRELERYWGEAETLDGFAFAAMLKAEP